MTKFKVGDKVRVVNVAGIEYGELHYYDGFETEVTHTELEGHVYLLGVKGASGVLISKRELANGVIELIESKPTKKQRITALEETVATLTQQVQGLQAQLDEMAQQSKPKVENHAYGFEKQGEVTGEIGTERTYLPQLTANEQRSLIIGKAKRFVTDALSRNHLGSRVFKGFQFTQKHKCEFVVNPEKRTVVALVKETGSKGLYARSITKCHVDDVFNEHIGKAIALGRALGLNVSEFTEAVQPDEVVKGHVVETFLKTGVHHETIKVLNVKFCEGEIHLKDGGRGYTPFEPHLGDRIINDTNAQY